MLSWKSGLAAVVLLAAFAWLLHIGALPIVPNRAAFAHVRWWVVPAYALLWSIVLLSRAARWYWLLKATQPVPMARVLRVSFIGLAALTVLPFRAGELVRPTLICRRSKISWWAATGTVGAERVVDGLFVCGVLLLGLAFGHPGTSSASRVGRLPVPVGMVVSAAYSALALFTCLFVALALFYWRRAWARNVVEKLVGVASPALGARIAGALERFTDGLRFLPRARFTLPFLAGTASYWLFNALGIQLLVWGCGLEGLTFFPTCVVLGVLCLGVLAPQAPGFFGAFQVSLYAALALYFAPEQVVGPGSAFVFVLYLTQLILTTGIGAIVFVYESLAGVS
jgi:glycosyltransferase 2 family protein